MKGKIEATKPIFLEYCASEVSPNHGYKQQILEAVCQLSKKTKGPVTAAMLREHTGIGKTAIQKHLHSLVKEGLLSQRYGKFKFEETTTICGCYEPTRTD